MSIPCESVILPSSVVEGTFTDGSTRYNHRTQFLTLAASGMCDESKTYGDAAVVRMSVAYTVKSGALPIAGMA